MPRDHSTREPGVAAGSTRANLAEARKREAKELDDRKKGDLGYLEAIRMANEAKKASEIMEAAKAKEEAARAEEEAKARVKAEEAKAAKAVSELESKITALVNALNSTDINQQLLSFVELGELLTKEFPGKNPGEILDFGVMQPLKQKFSKKLSSLAEGFYLNLLIKDAIDDAANTTASMSLASNATNFFIQLAGEKSEEEIANLESNYKSLGDKELRKKVIAKGFRFDWTKKDLPALQEWTEKETRALNLIKEDVNLVTLKTLTEDLWGALNSNNIISALDALEKFANFLNSKSQEERIFYKEYAREWLSHWPVPNTEIADLLKNQEELLIYDDANTSILTGLTRHISWIKEIWEIGNEVKQVPNDNLKNQLVSEWLKFKNIQLEQSKAKERNSENPQQKSSDEEEQFRAKLKGARFTLFGEVELGPKAIERGLSYLDQAATNLGKHSNDYYQQALSKNSNNQLSQQLDDMKDAVATAEASLKMKIKNGECRKKLNSESFTKLSKDHHTILIDLKSSLSKKEHPWYTRLAMAIKNILFRTKSMIEKQEDQLRIAQVASGIRIKKK